MAYWTLIGKGIGGDVGGRSFGVTLDTEKKTWVVGGPSVAEFFDTRSGSYNVVGVPEHGTQLVDARSTEVAFFTNLDGVTPDGSAGTSRASEKGVVFGWTLDSK
jgi:hypothetical protein